MAPPNNTFPKGADLSTISLRIIRQDLQRYHELAHMDRVSIAEYTRRALKHYADTQHN